MGNSKINQDTYIVLTSINGIKDYNIFGVLDGHGPEGHLVSQFISKYIQVEFQTHRFIEKLKTSDAIYKRLIVKDFEIIKDIFINADQALRDEDIDSKSSGTTCVLVIQLGEHIICANVGDSRAVLVFDEKNDTDLQHINVFPLSIDNKPENPEERERIIKMGGVVEQISNKYGKGIGPYRVWIKGKDYPGLAMSRSIGDFVGKNIGVIPDPEIIECNLSVYSKYIVICSDGVWEFLDIEEVMKLGKKYYLENNPRGYCRELIDKSVVHWKKEDVAIDDITVVTVFF
jgi:serine/threonine protein phosphatase PrpC